MSRRKAPKQEAPQTIEDAVVLIAEYRDILNKTDELKLDADTSIAAIMAARDGFVAPLDQRAKDIFKQLRAWWGVAAPALTEGKRKSVIIAGCKIGERTSTPALKHDGMKAEALVDQLAELGLAELLRMSTKLDKQACIAAISDNSELGQVLLWLGARNHQTEEFFIDRAEQKEPATLPVEIEEEAA
ncbi:host-nuclease inhibitor Gam family protein [Sphingobium abikonense]|uniref:host-nuclease inhibitor Gam family protein n=1 Tax=Sphingobium abikonense TaxID=86193 RepID=UPI003514307C